MTATREFVEQMSTITDEEAKRLDGGMIRSVALYALREDADHPRPSVKVEQVEAWQRCRKGSCQRHQDCMYTPCLSHSPQAQAAGDVERLPKDVYDFVSQACVLSTNHGGWFDDHGFRAISPLNAPANAILKRYAAALSSPLAEAVEKGSEDAPCYMTSEEANAWASGYNAALATLRTIDAGREG